MPDQDISSLTYTASLPLTWEPLASGASVQLLWRQSNVALLRALATLESQPPVEKELESDAHLVKAVERLESKLDIALAMIARLTIRQNTLPQEYTLTLGVRHLVWTCPPSLAPVNGSLYLLNLYLSPRFPEPLRIESQVEVQRLDGDRVACTGQFIDRDEEFEEWMTRTLFRYHRRALQARHSG